MDQLSIILKLCIANIIEVFVVSCNHVAISW